MTAVFACPWERQRRRCPVGRGLRRAGALAALLALAAGCERERRVFSPPGGTGAQPAAVRMSALQPGAATPPPPSLSPYDYNAAAISEGEQLYAWFNCVGCHFWGGGGIGPPLMDEEWIYGSAPQNIYSTIVEGRPNGMPSYRGKIPDNEVWKLVAYVRSMSGLVARDAASGRQDDLYARPQEQAMPDPPAAAAGTPGRPP